MNTNRLMNPFNPMLYDPTQSGGSLPIGKHPVVITAGEVTATAKNDGGMLVLSLLVIDGSAKDATGPYRLNLYNNNPQAVDIAHKQLAALCHVTQQFTFGNDGTDFTVLFNIPFVIEVGLQKGEEAAQKGYTEIKKVYDINGNEPGKAPANNQQQQVQQNQQNNNGGGAWGGQQQQTTQSGAPGTNGGQGPAWGAGNQQQQQQPQEQQQQNQQQANTGGAWQQNNNGGNTQANKPAWGAKT